MRVYCLQAKHLPALRVLVENQTLICLPPSSSLSPHCPYFLAIGTHQEEDHVRTCPGEWKNDAEVEASLGATVSGRMGFWVVGEDRLRLCSLEWLPPSGRVIILFPRL